MKAVSMPAVKMEYFPLAGGLDQLTPAISLKPGMLFDCMNYEPEISGGYRRIDGFERYDGRTSPTASLYWSMSISLTGNIFAGSTITGLSSSATGKVIGLFGTTLVLGRVSGVFIAGEALQISATTVAAAVSGSVAISEPDASNDADYMLLAANDIRADILVVPGSGPIRGVWVYNDITYAFRDNAGATAGAMWKATSGGWSQVVFGSEISFSSGTLAPVVGQTIKGATSGALGVVKAVLLRTGAWSGSAVGTIVYSITSGAFTSGEVIKDSTLTTTYATSSNAGAAITRLPGGKMEFCNANFTGSTATQRMYGCDGVNTAFEFDGTTYVPIHTGMTADAPAHIIFHRSYLFLSFLGSVQLSGIGAPYAWSVVLGAAEIALGDAVTGFMPTGGTSTGSALAIYTKGKTYVLYGTSTANFMLVASIYDIGYHAFTLQAVSNNTYGLTDRGIQALITTLTYGDFDYASISHLIQPFMTSHRGIETASTAIKTKDQYRLYFSDGYAVVVGLTGDKVSGLMPLNYGKAVRCITTTTLSNGQEVTYFGSDDGYVYQDNLGTSFDGNPIESWIRPAFNHSKSPRIRKRYRRAVFEVRAAGFSKVNIGYDLGYGNPDVAPPVGIVNSQVLSGGFWDAFTWDAFTWDGKVVSDVSMTLTGTEKNISFLFYSNRAQDKSHTCQGITLMFTPQRAER